MKAIVFKIAALIGVAALYVLAGQAGLSLVSRAGGVTLWPASGLALGLMLLFGRWIWPGIFLGAFVTSAAAHWGAESEFALASGAMGAALSNTLESFAACWLMERFAGGQAGFEQPQTVFRFLVVAVCTPAMSAILGVAVLSAVGLESWAVFGANWLGWWLGHLVSIVVLTPVLLVCKEMSFPKWSRRKWIDAVALLSVLIMVPFSIFGAWFTTIEAAYPLKFLAAPVLLWSAFRFGARGAAGSVLVLSALAIVETIGTARPGAAVTQDLLLLQIFMAVMGGMSLIVAADVAQRKGAEEGRAACEVRYQELYHADVEERRRSEAALKASKETLDRLNRELEQRVQDRTAQLQALNKELEAFAFSVSHDLRAPLRSIRGFSEVVLERYSQQIDPRGQEFLRRACESSQHMDSLIEDLLKLSRVTRAELNWQAVNLSALAAKIANELQQSEPEREVEFVIAPDLRASGDEHLLQIALNNLLRNAWKFTGKRQKARIEVGAAQDKAFFVRDNGAGFPMEYAQKLFGVFQRLHSNDDFPGTGVGLATVQRIINRHGGRVWATGVVDEGATFYFSLPEHPVMVRKGSGEGAAEQSPVLENEADNLEGCRDSDKLEACLTPCPAPAV